MPLPNLTQPQIERIAQIFGDTSAGYTGSEIEHHLAQCRIPDPDPGMTKWKRMYNAFAEAVNNSGGSSSAVYSFIAHCFEPAQALQNPERYKWMMSEINAVLMLVGAEIRDDGKYHRIVAAETASEVERRTRELRNKLTGYGAHAEVLKCCREELLTQDYFHAVQEAAKSLCDRVRDMTGLLTDGAALFNTAFSVNNPYVAFNSLRTSSEQNQQNGLKEMLCGVIHMVRNVTAHELRIHWDVNEKEAVDILAQISYLHKLLDECVVVKPSGRRRKEACQNGRAV